MFSIFEPSQAVVLETFLFDRITPAGFLLLSGLTNAVLFASLVLIAIVHGYSTVWVRTTTSFLSFSSFIPPCTASLSWLLLSPFTCDLLTM